MRPAPPNTKAQKKTARIDEAQRSEPPSKRRKANPMSAQKDAGRVPPQWAARTKHGEPHRARRPRPPAPAMPGRDEGRALPAGKEKDIEDRSKIKCLNGTARKRRTPARLPTRREGTAGRNHTAQTVAAHRVHRGITRTLSLLPHWVAAGVEVGVNGIYLHQAPRTSMTPEAHRV